MASLGQSVGVRLPDRVEKRKSCCKRESSMLHGAQGSYPGMVDFDLK